jgi:hypothetical protein
LLAKHFSRKIIDDVPAAYNKNQEIEMWRKCIYAYVEVMRSIVSNSNAENNAKEAKNGENERLRKSLEAILLIFIDQVFYAFKSKNK